MQRMTDFCQIVSMSRLFETLEKRVFQYPTLRNPEKGGFFETRVSTGHS